MKKGHREEIHDFCSSSDIPGVLKIREDEMGKDSSIKILVNDPYRRDSFERIKPRLEVEVMEL